MGTFSRWFAEAVVIATLAGCASNDTNEADAGVNVVEAAAEAGAIEDATTPDAYEDRAAAVVCSMTQPTSCPNPPLVYADIAPLIHERCSESCHSGIADGPWPLTDYEHIADWWDVIRLEVSRCTMPPPDAGPLSEDERLKLLTWILCGFKP